MFGNAISCHIIYVEHHTAFGCRQSLRLVWILFLLQYRFPNPTSESLRIQNQPVLSNRKNQALSASKYRATDGDSSVSLDGKMDPMLLQLREGGTVPVKLEKAILVMALEVKCREWREVILQNHLYIDNLSVKIKRKQRQVESQESQYNALLQALEHAKAEVVKDAGVNDTKGNNVNDDRLDAATSFSQGADYDRTRTETVFDPAANDPLANGSGANSSTVRTREWFGMLASAAVEGDENEKGERIKHSVQQQRKGERPGFLAKCKIQLTKGVEKAHGCRIWEREP